MINLMAFSKAACLQHRTIGEAFRNLRLFLAHREVSRLGVVHENLTESHLLHQDGGDYIIFLEMPELFAA